MVIAKLGAYRFIFILSTDKNGTSTDRAGQVSIRPDHILRTREAFPAAHQPFKRLHIRQETRRGQVDRHYIQVSQTGIQLR